MVLTMIIKNLRRKFNVVFHCMSLTILLSCSQDGDSQEQPRSSESSESLDELESYKIKKKNQNSLSFKKKEVHEKIADMIDEYLRDNMSLKRLHILDIESSNGYFTDYFSRKDQKITATDSNNENIEKLKRFNMYSNKQKELATFKHEIFNQDFVDSLGYNYSVAFLLNDAFFDKNKEYPKNIFCNLLEKIPFLFLRFISQKQSNQPEEIHIPTKLSELFSNCQNKILRLKVFEDDDSTVQESLYLIERKSILVNSKPYDYDKTFLLSFHHCDAEYKDSHTSKYYTSHDLFIKETIGKSEQGQGVIDFYDNFTKTIKEKELPIPLLKNYELDGERVVCVFERVKDAINVADCIGELSVRQKMTIVTQTLKTLSELEKVNASHNDVRPWNLLYVENEDKTYLIDFEFHSYTVDKNPKFDFLYLLYALNRGEITEIRSNKIFPLLKRLKAIDYGVFEDLARYIINNIDNTDVNFSSLYVEAERLSTKEKIKNKLGRRILN